MARNVTRGTLRTRIRTLADVTGSEVVTDAEINAFIDSAITELWDAIITTSWGSEYFNTSYSASVPVGGQIVIATSLPRFFKLRMLTVYVNGEWRLLPRLSDQELADARNGSIGEPMGYIFVDGNIELWPPPTTAVSAMIWYVPAAPVLAADSGSTGTLDTIDGWDQFVVWRCVGDVRHKEEDPGAAAADRKAAEQLLRIQRAAPFMDSSRPLRLNMVE